MASYDSDSSFDDDENYTETNVLLGYASTEPTDDTFSRVGGNATWLDDHFPPSARLARCKVCNDMMVLLLQLNGDLPQRFPGHERRLYLYMCRRKPCRRKDGSVRAFRATRIAKGTNAQSARKSKPEAQAPAPAGQSIGLGTQLFGGSSTNAAATNLNPFALGKGPSGSNPFAASGKANAAPLEATPTKVAEVAESSSDATNGLAETYASKLSLSASTTNGHQEDAPEPWPDHAQLPRPYTQYFLDADYEALSAEKEVDSSSQSKVTEMEVDGESSAAAGSGGADDKELFESSMDKTFQRFADRMRHNPEQILRYEFDGAALLYSSTDAVGKRLHSHDTGAANGKVKSSGAKGPPPCTNCGARRTFELQLTPYAIEMLEVDEPAGAILDGMDWGTIILGVCGKDCAAAGRNEGEVGHVEEWVGVQWEELTERPGVSSTSR